LDYYVYVITGDGELNEGIVWEAVQSAAHMRLGRLIAFADNNGWQSGGVIKDVSGLADISALFAAFGWHTQEIDGHNFDQILDAIHRRNGRRSSWPAPSRARASRSRKTITTGTSASPTRGNSPPP
jgi:transketolase N-terminal domain/subunit